MVHKSGTLRTVLQLSEIIEMMTSRVPCRYHEALDARHAPCYTATALSGTATVLYPCIWWHERPLCGPCNGFDILLSSKVILPTERLLALMVIQVVAIGECTFAQRCNEIWKKNKFPRKSSSNAPFHLRTLHGTALGVTNGRYFLRLQLRSRTMWRLCMAPPKACITCIYAYSCGLMENVTQKGAIWRVFIELFQVPNLKLLCLLRWFSMVIPFKPD